MKLLYFAWVRQTVGFGEEDFVAPPDVRTVAEVVEVLRARGTNFDEAFRDLRRLRCAVNQVHCGYDAGVGPNDEIAFFPPVTGG